VVEAMRNFGIVERRLGPLNRRVIGIRDEVQKTIETFLIAVGSYCTYATDNLICVRDITAAQTKYR
jgi:hypothetical protein